MDWASPVPSRTCPHKNSGCPREDGEPCSRLVEGRHPLWCAEWDKMEVVDEEDLIPEGSEPERSVEVLVTGQ
jgi:hypothetical protein